MKFVNFKSSSSICVQECKWSQKYFVWGEYLLTSTADQSLRLWTTSGSTSKNPSKNFWRANSLLKCLPFSSGHTVENVDGYGLSAADMIPNEKGKVVPLYNFLQNVQRQNFFIV